MAALTINLTEEQRAKLEKLREQMSQKAGFDLSLSKTVGKIIEERK